MPPLDKNKKRGISLGGCLRTNLLSILTVSGVIVGVALGFGLRAAKPEGWKPREVVYVRFIGDLFLQMLRALIVPLIVASMVSAIGSLDLSLSKRIGIRAIVFYLFTTLCAVILGIVLVTTIQPGKGSEKSEIDKQESRNVTTPDTLMDLIRNMFPPNLIEASIEQYRTKLIYPGKDNISMYDWKMTSEYTRGTNILGLVVFATVLGICLGIMKEDGKPLLDFFSSLSAAMMIITNWVVWLSPVGVCFLIAGQLIEQKNLAQVFANLGYYFGTVVAGLFIHGFIVLPLIFAIVCRRLPFRFMLNMTQAIATAFGTASSSATLPITIRCLEEKNGVDPRVARFLSPIGATINMDGTALYEAVAAIFIAQMVGTIQLDIGKIIAISITSTAASIGAAGIPQAGLVTMVMVLNTIGLPAEYVAYIIPVDWLLDRFRTAINVLGDSFGAGIVDQLSRKELGSLSEEPSELNEINHDLHRTETPLGPFPSANEDFNPSSEKPSETIFARKLNQ